ncbi:MAG: response regulator transcription factor [Corynebacteriales bacterium]|nr:response regulator transcription factor [Mycobacteriales bacterium]
MRVVIAEDSVLLREGIVRLLTSNDIDVVEAVNDAEALLVSVEKHQPDVVVTDVRMPPSHTDEGLRAALVIRKQWPDIAVVVLSQYVEERYATDLLSGDNRGVGYLLKDRIADVDEFVEALVRVGAGGTVLDPEVVSQLMARRGRSATDKLTPRETEVLALMAEGRSNLAIAGQLFIGESAVAKHVNSILSKLDIGNRPDDNRRVLAALRYLRIGEQ